MRMSATSSIGLVPTKVAGRLLVDPLRVTVMVPPSDGGGDHVVVGDDEAVLGDDHAGALVLFALPLTSMLTIVGRASGPVWECRCRRGRIAAPGLLTVD